MLRPYSGHNLTNHKVFNYRLSRARRYVECALEFCLRNREFSTILYVNFAIDIVKACCVLHNFVKQREIVNFYDMLVGNGFQDINIPVQVIYGGKYARECRNKFSAYFTRDDA